MKTLLDIVFIIMMFAFDIFVWFLTGELGLLLVIFLQVIILYTMGYALSQKKEQ